MWLETNIKLALQRDGKLCRIPKLLLYAALTLFKLCFLNLQRRLDVYIVLQYE